MKAPKKPETTIEYAHQVRTLKHEGFSANSILICQALALLLAKLDQLLLLLGPRRGLKRTPTAWNRHVSAILKAGGTIQQAASTWKKREAA